MGRLTLLGSARRSARRLRAARSTRRGWTLRRRAPCASAGRLCRHLAEKRLRNPVSVDHSNFGRFAAKRSPNRPSTAPPGRPALAAASGHPPGPSHRATTIANACCVTYAHAGVALQSVDFRVWRPFAAPPALAPPQPLTLKLSRVARRNSSGRAATSLRQAPQSCSTSLVRDFE
eukprot:COSAG03_NODE_57_length_15795_cov_83.762784_6_plen_175_part_00